MTSPPARTALPVLVSGGGPSGLVFALALVDLVPTATVRIHDYRWWDDDGTIRWTGAEQGNVRRRQILTLQSREFTRLPADVQAALFADPDSYAEVWPSGRGSPGGHPPRNIAIQHVEDVLLDLCNAHPRISLVPTAFDAREEGERLRRYRMLVIAEGAGSATRRAYQTAFGAPDPSLYSLDGQQVTDVALGVEFTGTVAQARTVIVTAAQSRYLVNTLGDRGYLNMRLTAAEAADLGTYLCPAEADRCRTCRFAAGCALPLRSGRHVPVDDLRVLPWWPRIEAGLGLFGLRPEDAVTATTFVLAMHQQPRFTACLLEASATAPPVFGALIGDAANAVHFWPGRGANTGLASAFSLACCLQERWSGRPLRDGDFMTHEGVMAMLQYRNKSRAWRAMVTTGVDGRVRAIQDGSRTPSTTRPGSGRSSTTGPRCCPGCARSATGSPDGCPACPTTRRCWSGPRARTRRPWPRLSPPACGARTPAAGTRSSWSTSTPGTTQTRATKPRRDARGCSARRRRRRQRPGARPGARP